MPPPVRTHAQKDGQVENVMLLETHRIGDGEARIYRYVNTCMQHKLHF